MDDSRHHGHMVQSPDFEYDDEDDDGSQAEDGVSYFGTAGQDYLLKQKRARRARALCWLDGFMLVDKRRRRASLVDMGLDEDTMATDGDGHRPDPADEFHVNMIIQHRLGLSALLITQYAVSTLLTQLHWITYSAHTPMSAALAYYDPLLTDSITFSRESRYIGSAPPHSRSLAAATPIRRGTSYGTMSAPSQFDTLQEMDEEERLDDDDDQDAFIKVNVNIRSNTHGTRGASYRSEGPLTGSHNQGATEDGREDLLENLNDHDDNDDEEQDMATLLAFQDARRQQVYAFSPTASSSAMPVRSILSPQSPPRDSSNPNRTPLSWAFCAGQEAYSSSKRSLRRSNLDPNGTGRRTWTGGHSIIYSGIFVEDSDDDTNDNDNNDVDVEVAAEDGEDPEADTDALVDADAGVGFDTHMQVDACQEACLHLSLEKTQDDRILTGSDGVDAVSDGTVKAEFDDNLKIEVDVAVAVVIETEAEHNIKVEVDKDRVQAGMDDTIKTEVLDTDSETMVEASVETVAVECDTTTTVTETHTAETLAGVHKQHDQDVKLTDALDDGSVHRDLDLAIRATESHMDNTHHPHFKDPSADTVEQESAIDISTPGGEPNGRHLTDGHHHHGLSTLKFNVSSRKDITAVVCDEDDCEEHPYQEGPAAELEAAIGSGFLGGHIVQLDIKESSTSAMEKTGDGINDFEDSSLPGTIKGLILPPTHDANGTGTEIQLPGTVDGLEDHGHREDSEEGHGSRQMRVRERIETVRVELETDGPIDPSNPAISAIIAGLETPDTRSPGPVTTIEDLSEGEGGHRRIHVRERIEQITVEEDDSVIGIVGPGGAIVGGAVGVMGPSGGVAGINPSAILIDSTKPLPRPPSPDGRLIPVPIPVSVPGQWTSTDETEQPTGVITWGYVDDVTPSDQGSYGIGVVSEPAIYVPRQRPAIVQPLLPEPVTVVRPTEPLITVGPTRGPIVVPTQSQPLIPLQPAPGLILQQPQPGMIMRPQPQPVMYAPPRRPMIVPPRPALPPPMPIIQPPAPVVMAPPPQAFVPQAQPQIIAPTRAIVPQPAIMAPAAPNIQPEYGTYETIVPGAVGVGGIAGGMGDMGGVGAWPGGAAGPLQRRHSIASIYDDRSIASIYEAENRSVASVYDDRTIVSIDGGVRGAGVGVGGALAVGMQGRHNWMAGRPLSGMEYGHHHQHHHLATAAHTAAPVESQRMALVADRSGGLVWDPEAGIYVRSRHVVRYSDPLRYDGGDSYSEDVYAGQRAESSRRGSWQEQGFGRAVDQDPKDFAVNRHVARPSESADSEMAYQEIELADGPPQLQEMVTETYFDTTRSQLKVREQKGQLIADVVRRLKDQQQRHQQDPQELRQASHAAQQKQQQPQYPPLSDRGVVGTPLSPPTNVSLLSRSLQNQQHPPTLNIPKPPSNPPPVRLLMNRGMAANQSQPRGLIALVSRSPMPTQSNGPSQDADKDDKDSLPILSTSSKKVETIMLQARHHKVPVPSTEPFTVQDGSAGNPRTRPPVSGGVLTALVPVTAASSAPMLARQDASGKPVWGMGGVTAAALVSPPSPSVHRKVPDGLGAAVSAAAAARKAKKKQHIAMSRHQLHPILLAEGVMACWNNEFGGALEMFKEHACTYPRWSLAAAEVHITRQLISGQLSEADSELIDALQLSEKVATRILDKKQELDSSFMSYRSICSADATLVMVNDNTLRQNYKWDCEMAFYDTLLYRGILQLTSSADTKGTFSDIKGGLQLRRAWKGYMRIKQEIEAAKDKWQKLSAIVEESGRGKEGPAEKENRPPAVNKEHAHAKTSGAPSAHVGVSALPPRPSRTATMPVPIPPTTSNAKRNTTLLSTSQPTEGSRWSIFGRRGSVSHSAASLSTSPAEGADIALETSDRTRSKLLSSSNPVAAKGLASALRDQAKAVEDFKTAVRVLEDVEDYLHYGLGLFFFIVSIVPKSLLPALKTIGLQSNHEQGIKHLEAVFTRKNGRAPFAALFLLINYLFLPRGMDDPKISLGRAGEIISECLKSSPNGSSYLLMACHHARKTGSMIPAALNHITRGIQTCEAAGIPSINYRFELGLTFFINQEFGKAADIFEILWRRFTMNMAIGGNGSGAGAGGMEGGRRRKGRSSSLGSSLQAQLAAAAQSPVGGMEEEEEDDFELAPFCGLCLVASKVVMRLGQEGYFEYGRDGFGRGGDEVTSMAVGVSSEGVSGSTTPLNYPRTGPESDLLMAAQEVLAMMAGSDIGGSTMKSTSGGSIFEHTKAGSNQSTWSNKDMDGSSAHLQPPPAHAGKLNRFNKFAWNQCQKSLQRGRISPFLPLVILYLRRDLAYMKPVLLRKFRTLVETIWKASSIPQPADGDTQAIYLLLSAVVHRQLLPDDSTFAYTALTDCLLLESTIESEMWVIPHCHYELGELLFKKLHLPQAALEQFQWIVKGPGKEARPTSIFYAPTNSNSNPRLSVFGGGFPSDSVTNLVESAAAAAAAAGASQQASQGRQGGGREGGHSHYPSTTSNHRLSQLFLGGTSPTPLQGTHPPNPVTFYNSRYKKFEFSQVLRQRSSISLEQIQKVIENGDTGSASSSRRTSMNWLSGSSSNQPAAAAPNKNPVAAGHGDVMTAETQQRSGQSLKRHSSQSLEAHGDQGREAVGAKAARLSSEAHAAEGMEGVVSGGASASANVSVSAAAAAAASQSWSNSGSNNTLPNILSDAQRKRGSQQLGLPAQLRPSPSFNVLH
ncbi:hypothetical protein BGZ70_008814, partial [Mortierella alpina]